MQGKRHEALWYEWLNFLYSYGGDMLDVKSGSECGPGHRQQPASHSRYRILQELDAASPPDTLNYFWDDVMALMQQGKVAELIMWNDSTYAVAVDENASTVVGKMGFDLVPQGEGGKVAQVEGWTYLIPAASKNKEASYLFIQWMMAYDQQLNQHLNGGATACRTSTLRPTFRSCPIRKRRWSRTRWPSPSRPPAIERNDRHPGARAVVGLRMRKPRRRRSIWSMKEIGTARLLRADEVSCAVRAADLMQGFPWAQSRGKQRARYDDRR